MERQQQQQQPEQRVSMTSSPMRGLLSRMLSDPYGGKDMRVSCCSFVFSLSSSSFSRVYRAKCALLILDTKTDERDTNLKFSPIFSFVNKYA